jgi:RNA polymerase sigma-70 factor (ECF subfamily)
MQDRDAALDLVQDAFAKKFGRHCSQIEFSKVKTYLFTTVNNLYFKHYQTPKWFSYPKNAT